MSSNKDTSSLLAIKRARTSAALSIGINLVLAIGKGITGIYSNSAALLGDAINSGADVLSALAAFIGLSFASMKHPSFPYGLYKAENIATLITSIIIIIAGYEIGRQAILGPAAYPDITIAMPVALISLTISLIFGFYQLGVGKRLNSPALVADARDYLADSLSTGVVVVSLLGSYFGFNLDSWAAGLVSIFVFWSGGQLLFKALRDLMDKAIDRDTEREIIGLVENHPRVVRVERCLSRTAGGRFLVDLDVILKIHSYELADHIVRILEKEILEAFPRVVMIRIKALCHKPEHIHRFIPVDGPKGVLAEHLAKAPWFLLQTIDRISKNVISEEYIRNPYSKKEHKRGFLVGKWLLEFKPDQIIVAHKKEGTIQALLEGTGVEINLASNTTNKRGY